MVMFDPANMTDVYGLSADSMRGSEQYIIASDVGESNRPSPLSHALNMSRKPLSYHEATTLRRKGLNVPDEAVHESVTDHQEFMTSILPDPAPSGPDAYNPLTDQDYQDFLAWKRSRDARGPATPEPTPQAISPNVTTAPALDTVPFGTHDVSPTEHAAYNPPPGSAPVPPTSPPPGVQNGN